jgi:hypothetical protein
MWGIYAINDTLHPDVYTPRPHYYTFKQLFKFVKPGFKRIDISTSLKNLTVSAYYNPANGAVVITGKNDSDQQQEISGILKNLSSISSLKYFYSDETHHFLREADVPVTHQGFSETVPPYCVFTLVSK